jgi:multiple sugar transport system substrate-binding protein
MANASSPAPVQAAAWKLAAYLTSQPARYFKEAALFQPVAEFVASAEFKADKIMPVFLSEMSKSFYHPRIAGFNEVLDALARTRDRIIVGHEDMDKVLAEAQDEVTGILAKALKDAKAAVK